MEEGLRRWGGQVLSCAHRGLTDGFWEEEGNEWRWVLGGWSETQGRAVSTGLGAVTLAGHGRSRSDPLGQNRLPDWTLILLCQGKRETKGKFGNERTELE